MTIPNRDSVDAALRSMSTDYPEAVRLVRAYIDGHAVRANLEALIREAVEAIVRSEAAERSTFESNNAQTAAINSLRDDIAPAFRDLAAKARAEAEAAAIRAETERIEIQEGVRRADREQAARESASERLWATAKAAVTSPWLPWVLLPVVGVVASQCGVDIPIKLPDPPPVPGSP